jgi:putative endonuclease
MREVSRRSQGAFYEALACSFLKSKGYRILDRNVYLLRKELDIVAMDADTVVFVEVKGRTSSRFGMPSEAVTARKRQNIIRTANAYLEKMHLGSSPCRFDVISVMLEGSRNTRFEHIENAFEV